MDFAQEIAALYRRDLTRLLQELEAFPDDDTLWRTLPGVSNSAGNLAQHLEGNLREYVGRQVGNVAYQRQRDAEFSALGLSKADLVQRLTALRDLILPVIEGLSPESLDAMFPQQIYGAPISTRQLLVALQAHLNYHLGQIDYLRRVLTGVGAIEFVGL
jgi:hypothetical protein